MFVLSILGNPNFGRKGKMSKGRNIERVEILKGNNVEEIDFSSYRF